MKALRVAVIAFYLTAATLPLAWLLLTTAKSNMDAISPHMKVVPVPGGSPTSESSLFHATFADSYGKLAVPLPGDDFDYFFYLKNSAIIGILSTLTAVGLGTCCAYGFSRFRVAGAQDWLFFILSTRFLPPLAVVLPIFRMYQQMELHDTHFGLILLYTVFNLSLSVWLMKGFIDEIPKAYEEAALVDGYTRFQAFWKIIVPQAATGMAVTAVFCLIAAWNEYGFAVILTQENAKTVPIYFSAVATTPAGVPWPRIAGGIVVFVVPIIVFTVLVRKHLLRGVTFGTVKG
jgi:multiple sugar transport system permease protein